MSVRVIARIRPLLKHELDKDAIVTAESSANGDSKTRPTIVRLPNPKNFAESFSFQFSSVFEQDATQQEIFDAESRSCASSACRIPLTRRQYHLQSSTYSMACMPARPIFAAAIANTTQVTSRYSPTAARGRAKRIPCAAGRLWRIAV
jgi:hypothetical protein